MKKGLSEKRLQQAVDLLEQCALTMKFYVATKELKYLDKLRLATEKLNNLLAK